MTRSTIRKRNCANPFGRSTCALLPIVLAAWLTVGVATDAVGAPPAKAEDILDRFVEVTGGKAAYAKLENRVTKMTIDPVGSGMKIHVTTYAARPNKTYAVIEAEALGRMEKGTNGNVVWENSLMRGPVIKDGQERAFVLRASMFDKQVNWRKLYPKVECVGVEDVEGKPAYKVELTPADGSIETAYFDKGTGLQVKVALKLSLPMGTIPIEILFSDYRKVDGVLFYHKARRLSAGQEMLMTTESIEHNLKMPADRFKLPDDIQAMVDKRSEKRKAATP